MVTLRRATLLVALVSAVGLAMAPGISNAEVIVSNLSETRTGANSFVAGESAYAQQFFTSSTAFAIGSVTLNLSKSSDVGQFSVSVFSDSSNTPGSAVAGGTVAAGVNGSTLGLSLGNLVTFNGLNIALSPSTAYWMVVEGSGGFDGNWGFTNSSGGTGGVSQLNTSGATSSSFGAVESGFPMRMEVVAVPEPGTVGLLAAGGLGLAGIAVRRRFGR